MVPITGILGLVCIIIGWVFEAAEIIRKKRSKVDLKFGSLYVLGSLMLVIYSFQIKDYIFFILNFFVMIMGLISLFFSVKKRG
jgi:lipid-A-disaccharide synthase-like uncharacterized protein